jgi:hypothetical protein
MAPMGKTGAFQKVEAAFPPPLLSYCSVAVPGDESNETTVAGDGDATHTPPSRLRSGLVSGRGKGEISRVPAPIDILTAVSAAAFLFYGLACVLSAKLVAEFERYQLARWRVLVGLLEVAGALGLIAGWWFPPLQTAAAAGLFLLMLCGLWARWRIRDPWYAMLPAFVLAVINLAIVLRAN